MFRGLTNITQVIYQPEFLVGIFAALAAFAAILTVAMPLFSNDKLQSRMRYVSKERDKMRAVERARLNAAPCLRGPGNILGQPAHRIRAP